MSHPSERTYRAWQGMRRDLTDSAVSKLAFAAGWDAAAQRANPLELVTDVAIGLMALEMPVLSRRDPREVWAELGDRQDVYVARARFILGFAVS